MPKKFPIKLHRLDLFPGFFFCFVPSDEDLQKIARWATLKLEFPAAGMGRHQSIVNGGQTISMIMLGATDDRHNHLSLLGGLVHECSHAVDELFEHIGESSPSPELRCYTLQYIFETLYPLAFPTKET